jgi:hypothetical protein
MGMTRRLIQATTLLLLSGACAAAGPGAPQAVSASYEVFMNGGRVAVMDETFEAKDGQYRIVSESHAVGLLKLFVRQTLRVTSRGRLTGAGLAPQHFEGKRGDDDPRQVRAEFDWEGQQLKVTRKGRTQILPLPPRTQDQLSIMYQFMFLAPDRPQVLQLSRTTGRKVEQHRYTVRTGVEIETPLGHMATVHLVRQQPPDEEGVEIWLAPRYRYLPVKLLILDDNGARYEQVMTKLEIKP